MPRRSSVAAALPAADFTAAIAERAYFKAERRGFAPGHEVEDWLAAEREIGSPVRGAAAAAAPKRSAAPKLSAAAKPPAAPRKNGAASKPKASKTK